MNIAHSIRFMRCALPFAAIHLMLMIVMCAAGCKSSQVLEDAPADAPSLNDLVTAHNQRAQNLQRLYGRGVIEFRWLDQKGKHTEQGDMELWLQQPHHTALRVSKVGEVFVWLGSDSHRYWLFDLLKDEKILSIGRHDQPSIFGDAGVFSIKPLAMLDLMGVTPIRTADEAKVLYQRELRAWVVEAQGMGGPVRIFFDRQTLLPIRAESLNEQGEAIIASRLTRYEGVTQQSLSPLNWPRLAHQIDIETIAADSESASAGEIRDGRIRMVFDRSTGQVEAAELERVFNLEVLIRALRPSRIEDPFSGSTASAARSTLDE